MANNQSRTSGKVAFHNFHLVEPENLLTFTPAYDAHVIELKKYLSANEGKWVTLLIKRIQSDGKLVETLVQGQVGKINETSFTFVVTQEPFGATYDHPHSLLLRFDNVLGNIPLLQEFATLKLLKISTPFTSYVRCLADMRELLKTCVGTVHAATLYYHYSKDKPVYRDGGYHIKCEITAVNRSNVEYNHVQTFAFVDEQNSYSHFVPGAGVDRFIAPDRYLKAVSVSFGVEHKLNVHAED